MKILISLFAAGFIFSTFSAFSFTEGVKTNFQAMQQARTAQIDEQVNAYTK